MQMRVNSATLLSPVSLEVDSKCRFENCTSTQLPQLLDRRIVSRAGGGVILGLEARFFRARRVRMTDPPTPKSLLDIFTPKKAASLSSIFIDASSSAGECHLEVHPLTYWVMKLLLGKRGPFRNPRSKKKLRARSQFHSFLFVARS